MKILRINHIALVSKNNLSCLNFFQNILGLENLGQEIVADQKVNVDMLALDSCRFELLTPTAENSPISKFLATKGSGIHHIALEVDDIDEWLHELKKKNIKLIDTSPRIGAHSTKIAFVHPEATGGILVEFVQPMH